MKFLKEKKFLILIIVAILSLASLIYFKYIDKPTNIKSYDNFLTDFNSNNVIKVSMDTSNDMKITLKDNSTYVTSNPKTPTFKEDLLKKGIDVSDSLSPNLSISLPSTVLTISLISLVFITLSKSKASAGSGGLNLKKHDSKNNENLSFDSVAGNEEAKESVKDIVDFLRNPEKYKKYGARMPKGIILYGEPGTGKTLLAKAVAGEADVPFFALSGSDFVQMYVGVGAARIRNLFKKAKSCGKAVIFIDEIDAIGKKRNGNKSTGGSDERDQTLNALLTEMSGFGEQEGIVVMAATNRLDMLDSALLRPGRFDRHVEVSLPDIKARERIIELYLKNKPNKNINIKTLAQKTSYFSGAKLESLVNEAAILAAKEDTNYISEEHINLAYSIVMAGYEKTNREHITHTDRKITAFHEAGHALASLIIIPEDTVSKITIIPTTKGAGGYTLTISEDKCYHTLDYLKRRTMVLLAGRASEELIFGKDNITTGAHNDISKCTNIVKDMITEYGMGETIGLLKLSDLGSLQGAYGNKIVEECKDIVSKLYDETMSLLEDHKDILNNLSNELLENESLDTKDLEKYISSLN